MLRNYGCRNKNEPIEAGFNSRLDTLQAAVLRRKLPHLDDWNVARRSAAAFYRENLAQLPIELKAPPRDLDFPTDHVYHLFPIEVEDRDQVQQRLRAKGIHTGIHYPIPIHATSSMASLGYREGDFPNAERAARRLLSLPLFPEIREDQLHKTVSALKESLCE
jgi:dTDP-4-amino-4,6-dideoxygalactose transaminase